MANRREILRNFPAAVVVPAAIGVVPLAGTAPAGAAAPAEFQVLAGKWVVSAEEARRLIADGAVVLANRDAKLRDKDPLPSAVLLVWLWIGVVSAGRSAR
jgi:hypothetical protein